MFWSRRKTAMVLVLWSGLLASGCASQAQYRNPYSQEESSRTYRELYPQPFTLEQGPSATSSGEE
jgi:hypothetical protein